MQAILIRFRRCCKGSTALEYAFIAAIVSISLMLTVRTIGTEAGELYSYLVERLVPSDGAGGD